MSTNRTFQSSAFEDAAVPLAKVHRTHTDRLLLDFDADRKELRKGWRLLEHNLEMTAPAFARYVMDKLPYISDYLRGAVSTTGKFFVGKSLKSIQEHTSAEKTVTSPRAK